MRQFIRDWWAMPPRDHFGLALAMGATAIQIIFLFWLFTQ